MASSLSESRVDHRGEPLPDGVYALVESNGDVVSYKARWRECDDNGVRRQRSKSFSRRDAGSLDRARGAAIAYREGALEVVRSGDTVLRADRAAGTVLGDLFKEWITRHAAPNTGERYARDAVRTWDKHIEPRLGRVKLGALADDPGIIVRFHEDLQDARLAISARRASLALLRAVLRWGRRRYPRVLTVDVAGLFRVPSAKRRRLIRAADPLAVERIIEAVLDRPHRDPLGPIRDAALVAAMGFTVAARPSEWLVSATWRDVREGTVELQAVQNELGDESEAEVGLKTGARVALLLPNAYDRLMAYRRALEERYGRQPDNALVFQEVSRDGPLWYKDGFPVEWSADHYKRWTARVWRPARQVAAQAPDTEDWIAGLTFYELRHTAISTALHSTLVMTKDGMNLHTLAAYAGHDVQTMQRYYAHVIARYRSAPPIDLEGECKAARERVESHPFQPAETPAGPQRQAQRRRRARARTAPAVTARGGRVGPPGGSGSGPRSRSS
jgi:integrase